MRIKLKGKKNKIGILVFCLLTIMSIIGIFLGVEPDNIVNINTAPNSDIKQLLELPYLAYVKEDSNPERKGVTLYKKDVSYDGINLYSSVLTGGARLLDMNGNVIHSWFSSEIMPYPWGFFEMDRQGNLLVLNSVGIGKLDWDSNIKWISKASENPHLNDDGEYLRAFATRESGDIYVLATQNRTIQFSSLEMSILDFLIVGLNSEGIPKRKNISVYDLLNNHPQFVENLDKRKEYPNTTVDAFHCNSIEEIKIDIGVSKKGNVLFCCRHMDLIGIVDIETEKLIWSWGPGILEGPHQPKVLENGNILVFDNGRFRNYSRILELNPNTGEIVWSYEADPQDSFFTSAMGGNQRLDNGNTIITESIKGHVFEVTENGEIVWEFWVPEFDKNNKRGVLYRMPRLDHQFFSYLESEDKL